MFYSDVLEKIRESLDLRASISAADYVENNLLYDGSYFSTRYRDYQRDILNDFSEKVCIIKMSQTGLTTTFQMKMLAFSKIFPGKKGIIFTMPTDRMVKNFARTRLLPTLEENIKIFPKNTNADIRSADLVTLGKVSIHLLGCESDNSAFSTPSDYNIYDEVDETKQNALDNLSSRLQGSALRMEHKLSTPTFENFGIHKEYQLSSKGVYKTKCDRCNHWNNPKFRPDTFTFGEKRVDVEFFEDLPLELWRDIISSTNDIWVGCEKCGHRLIFGDPMRSQWVHEYPSIAYRGYAVTPFCLDKYNPNESHSAFVYIFRKFIDHSLQGNLEKWYRSVLGIATEPDNNRIGEQAVRAVMNYKRPTVRRGDPIYIGIDMGQTCFVTFMSPEGHIIRFLAVPLKKIKQSVKDWMDMYDVKGGCVDLYPETEVAQEIKEISNYRILPVRYSTRKNADKIEEVIGVDRQIDYLYVDRNHSLDKVAHNLREQKMTINGWEGIDDDIVVRHFADNFKENKDTGVIRWLCPHNTDHGFHSAGYAGIAREYWGGEGFASVSGVLPFIISTVDCSFYKTS